MSPLVEIGLTDLSTPAPTGLMNEWMVVIWVNLIDSYYISLAPESENSKSDQIKGIILVQITWLVNQYQLRNKTIQEKELYIKRYLDLKIRRHSIPMRPWHLLKSNDRFRYVHNISILNPTFCTKNPQLPILVSIESVIFLAERRLQYWYGTSTILKWQYVTLPSYCHILQWFQWHLLVHYCWASQKILRMETLWITAHLC